MTTAVALISGPNVFLRYPIPVDEAEFVALRQASRDLHSRWEPTAEDGVDPAGPQMFASMIEKANTPGHQKHLICRVADGRVVGYVGLNEIVMGPFRSAYLGYWTGAPYARRGYGREAVGLASPAPSPILGCIESKRTSFRPTSPRRP